MKKTKHKFDNKINESMTENLNFNDFDEEEYRYQLEIMRQRVKFDIAWQIFDEINYYNDSLQYVDMSCLDHNDAIAITK